MQGMHYYFITEPNNLLKLFLPAFVINISKKQLKVLFLKNRFYSFGN